MDKEQLRELIVRPTLKEIPHGESYEAVLAIMMIIAHESLRGHYLKQTHNGPALGLGNMEPLTHDDTWRHGDSIWRNAGLLNIITPYEERNAIHPKPERMIYDLRYAVFMMRQRLFMKREKLPKSLIEMSKYLKKFWNSTKGAADGSSYAVDYKLWSDY